MGGSSVEWEWAGAITDCALDFMQMSRGESARTITECLQALGARVEATRVVLFEAAADNSYGDAIYEWHAPERSPQVGARYKSSELPEAFRAFNRGETVVAIKDADHPYEGMRANMIVEDLAAVVITPIRRGERTAWCTVFSWHGASSELEEQRVSFCERASRMLDVALVRQQELKEQLANEEKRLHSQRLENLGLLSGGIAHDFNNVLQAVLGLSELLRRGGDRVKIAQDLIHVSKRAAKITRRLLLFSSHKSRNVEFVSVAAILKEVVEFLRHSIPEDRQIKLVMDAPEAHVSLASTDLEHAIVNLCTNSSAAMPKGGSIELGCRLVPETSMVEIWVEDSGKGMTPEQLSQAREPFFTTKPVGEGTGLGLAMVDTMVQHAGGSLRIESELGQGTRVSMRLPIAAAQPAAKVSSVEIEVRGTETVLVVEDDPVILRVTASHLERAGFCVLKASGGREAFAIYKEHQQEIRLVVTDVIMPGGGGAELYEAISELAPSLPFLLATGYDAGTFSNEVLNKPNCRSLEKPFQGKALLRLVRDLIDATP